jgi:hypothetical protein
MFNSLTELEGNIKVCLFVFTDHDLFSPVQGDTNIQSDPGSSGENTSSLSTSLEIRFFANPKVW